LILRRCNNEKESPASADGGGFPKRFIKINFVSRETFYLQLFKIILLTFCLYIDIILYELIYLSAGNKKQIDLCKYKGF